jgi:hypothetical protein
MLGTVGGTVGERFVETTESSNTIELPPEQDSWREKTAGGLAEQGRTAYQLWPIQDAKVGKVECVKTA